MNDRRSPADRTNGNAGSRCGGVSVERPSNSLSSSSMARWTRPSSVRTRDQTTSGSSMLNTNPGGRFEDGIEECLAGRRSGAEPGPLDGVGEGLGTAVRRRPQHGRGRRVVGQRRAERPVEVVDDGRGIDADDQQRSIERGHIGLHAQTRRLEAAGGTLTVTGGPSGTIAVAEVPV
ncbi:MAG: hypothetical protein ACRDZ2_07375 [Ilumatobacteraceae bacterium]